MSNLTNPSSVAGSILMQQGQEVELLDFVNDDYGGVIVEMKAPMDPTVFASSLRASISNWRKQVLSFVSPNFCQKKKTRYLSFFPKHL
jgi:Nudix hydrolase domain